MTIINTTYGQIDDVLERLADSDDQDEFLDEGLAIEDEEHMGKDVIVVRAPAFRVTDKGLIFAEGVYCNYLEDLGAYDAGDWSLTLIYQDVPDKDFDPRKWVYFEQDPPAAAIHNYLDAVENTGFMPG